jgi:hypothetical protein
MTNTNVTAKPVYPVGGSTNDGYILGYIDSGAKAAQNDTWTVTNASKVLLAWPTLDATGAAETHTIATNVITLTGATGTACSGLVLYKP